MLTAVLIGNLIAAVLAIGVVQGSIVLLLKKRDPEKYRHVLKPSYGGFTNVHTVLFSRYLYQIKGEEDHIIRRLKVANILVFPYVILSAIIAATLL